MTRAARATRLLAAVAPRSSPDARARRVRELRAGTLTAPRWTYTRPDLGEGPAISRAARDELHRLASTELAGLYGARLDEIESEQAMMAAVGTARLGELARARFASASTSVARAATALATEWIGDAPIARSAPGLMSDALDSRSLVSRMRAEVGRLRLPFRVVVDDALGALAATGERTIFIAKGRTTDDEDVARTVMHEVLAHAAPRARAAELTPGIFAIGTARGTDDQEGLALVLESRHGFLTPRRRRELAARHVAVMWMLDSATFVDVANKLSSDHAFPADEALRVAERAFRGDDGTRAGLGRERVYLESFVRVGAWLEASPEDEAVLSAGQVALDAVTVLRPFVATPRQRGGP